MFFDTETDFTTNKSGITKHKLKVGWLCYWQRSKIPEQNINIWHEFHTTNKFWNHVENYIYSKTRLVLISHNIVFDFTIVDGWNELINRGWTLSRLYEKGRTFIAKYKKGNKSILILDNMNFFLTSIDNLGKQIGYKKLKIDFNNYTNEELSIYCKRDVEILLKTWQSYMDWFISNDLGNFGVTISSQSFNTFRHRFMHTDIFIHNRKYVSNLERESYYGGRTECFKIGSFKDNNFYYLDINSMYPSVMQENYFPVKYLRYDKKCNPIILGLYLNKYCLTARLLIKTEDPIFPIRINNKVVFPVGTFEVVLATPELKLALEKNIIQKVISVTIYEKAQIFKDFIEFFYNERLKAKQSGNTAYDLFFKIIMNSLYGKFGQLMGEWESVGKCNPKEIDYWSEVIEGENYIYKYRKINGLIQRYNKKREAFNSFPAISAHVTSYARIKLWNLISKAKISNVYYCDTDSLFVNEAGYKNLKDHINNSDLGKLKVECTSDNIKIFGCKQYIFKDKVKHKGIKKDAIIIDKNTYQQSQWATLKTLIINKNLHDYQVKDVVKHLSGIYDKGTVLKNGTVKPLIL